ncbi:MAG: cell wall-binding repeat-containing protein [Desulfitobacteriaceae bacterium]
MRKTKKTLAILAIVAMVLTMIPLNAFAATAATRLSGNTAVQTAQAIAQDGWTTSANAVIAPAIAYNMVDALAAAPLAAVLNAPVLLTDGDQLSAEAKAEIQRLGVAKVYVASGLAVIKAGVIADLQGLGVQVISMGGYDQYETSVNIAKEIAKVSPTTKIFIANGETARVAQDALSVASLAGATKQPLLLTQKGQLPTVVATYIDSIKANVTDSYIIGGTGVVSDDVKAQLPGTVSRNAGNDAYDTNLAVLTNFTTFDFSHIYVANGETMIDALAGAPLAAATAAPIVLVNGSVKTAATDFLKGKVNSSTVVTALGGAAVVSDNVRNTIANPSELNVTSVAGTTSSVYDGTDDQVLTLTVGGVAKTVNELESSGYTVEFQATEPVFTGDEYDSNDGYLVTDLSDATSDNNKFDYVVEISKDGAVVSTSASKRVTVKDAGTGTDAIESAKIFLADEAGTIDGTEVEIKSGTLDVNDIAYLRVRGTNSDDEFGSITAAAKYSSSDPSIAYVSKNETVEFTEDDKDYEDSYAQIILGGSTGSVTLTVTSSSSVKKTISLKVVDEDRVASASKTDIDKSTAVKLSTDATQQFGVTVKDQFGDPMKGYEIALKGVTSGADEIATAEVVDYDEDDGIDGTDKKGRIIVEVTGGADQGSGTLTIKDDDAKTLGTVSVSNTDTAGNPSKYKINLLPFETKELDINDVDTTTFKIDVYDSSGYKVADGADIPDLTVKVDGKACNDDADVNSYVTVDYTEDDHQLALTAKKVKSGSITIAVYQGGSSFQLASTSVTVKDTRAKITGATFESNIPDITTETGIKLSRVIKESGIKTDDGNPVTFYEDENHENIILIKTVDGTIIGNLKLSVLDGDLTPTFTGTNADANLKIAVTSDTEGESGTIRISVNKLSGVLDDNGVPSYATSVTSKNLTVTDLVLVD